MRKKRAKHYTDEWCPECCREMRIPIRTKPLPRCKCGESLVPCSACDDSDGMTKRCAGCESGSKFKLHPGYKLKKTGFRLLTLIRWADKAHGADECVIWRAFKDYPTVGDILAPVIAHEIVRTYDQWATKHDQLVMATDAISKARAQLEDVECAFREKLRKLEVTKLSKKIRRRKKCKR